MRLFVLFLLVSPVALAEGETRLGTLIRLYLREPSPSRQFELVDKVDRLVDGDIAKVAAAIRRGEHCRFAARPSFGKGGPAPSFAGRRVKIVPVADSAGDFARLALPEGYDPERAHPLVLEIGPTSLPVGADAVRVTVDCGRHPQAAQEALAAEGLVLSILAHTLELVHVDADRVFLRAEAPRAAALAWYLALHNPDRFAGLFVAKGFWREAASVATNSLYFPILAVAPRQGDPALSSFFALDSRFPARHKLLPFPNEMQEVLHVLQGWEKRSRREANPARLELRGDREGSTRAYWARVAPRRHSIKHGAIGRVWKHRSMAMPAAFIAERDPKDRNLIRVRTYRVAAFHLYVDPEMFDVARPLRVSINGGVPIANLIDQNLKVGTLLEDYRERRDPQLLYAASFSFTVRREPARPPR